MKIALVCSHGGHLTETLQILTAFREHEFFFASYHSARDEDVRRLGRAHFMKNIGVNIARMVYAFGWAFYVLRKERPDAVISLGAEIALPYMYVARLLRIRTLYIESWCRVENLSLTGRLVYPVVDSFWVQWPQLLAACGPKAQHHGAVA